jgi:hypothetical protein
LNLGWPYNLGRRYTASFKLLLPLPSSPSLPPSQLCPTAMRWEMTWKRAKVPEPTGRSRAHVYVGELTRGNSAKTQTVWHVSHVQNNGYILNYLKIFFELFVTQPVLTEMFPKELFCSLE